MTFYFPRAFFFFFFFKREYSTVPVGFGLRPASLLAGPALIFVPTDFESNSRGENAFKFFLAPKDAVNKKSLGEKSAVSSLNLWSI